MPFFMQSPASDGGLHASVLAWAVFNGFVLLMLALDLGVFHRKAHTVRVKEAVAWTLVWVVLAFLFAGGILYTRGTEPALQFVAGYLIEKSLSVDNLFVFLVLFSYFKVPTVYQHKVLFWGILGALVMRAALIALGAVLITRFHWTMYLFGAFLVFTGIKLAFQKGEGIHPEHNPVVKLVRRIMPVSKDYAGSHFFVKEGGRRFATPLLLVLLTVEFTDLVFALDSIPAIFAVTPDPFIVYTSNVFAILGLRSLYFALAGIMDLFHYLKLGLAVVLGFVGVKMLIADLVKIPIGISLAVVGAILAISVVASLIWKKAEVPAVPPPPPVPASELEEKEAAMIFVYLLLAALLLFLNAFFVLAEFAAVRLRTTRTRELVKEGAKKAAIVEHVQSRLDEYLSVCQLGITFASIGLGFVGEPIVTELLSRTAGLGSAAARTIALAGGYVVVSALHVVVELLPKSIAIRKPEGAALWTALPLRFFHYLFFVPLMALNGATMALLRLLGISRKITEQQASETELRQILGDSADRGVVSIDRLLLLENIFDLRELRVRDIMRPRSAAKVIRMSAPWEENLSVIRTSRFSRFPLLDGDRDLPDGIVHIKDLYYEESKVWQSDELRRIARPYLTTPEDAPVEQLLRDLRHHRTHLVMVLNAEGRWTGFLSLEDVIEEIVGSIEDEFEVEPPTYLADAVSPGRVVLGIEASGLEEAIGQAFGRVPASELPLPAGPVVQAVLERERAMSTYLGKGVAIPHARLEKLERPVLLIARSDEGIPIRNSAEKARFLFILLTPAGSPRLQARLLARIAELFQSEFIEDRLTRAPTPEAVVEAIRAAEPITTTAA